MTCNYIPPLTEQLHGPDPTAGSDCAICCARMAIMFATCGAVNPSPDKIRAQSGLDAPNPPPSDYSTTITEYAKAVNAFDDEAKGKGYEGIGAGVHERGSWEDQLAPLIRDEVKWATVFVDYGTVNDAIPGKTGDKNFRGAHAIGVFGYVPPDESGSGDPMVKVFDPLCDGRASNIPKGPVWWPMYVLREAADAYAGGGDGTATWCATPRSKLTEPDNPPEPPDPCATVQSSDRTALLNEAMVLLREKGSIPAARLALALWIWRMRGGNPEGLALPVHAGVKPDED